MVKLDRLQKLRREIDEIDNSIIKLLDRRIKLVKEIGLIKKRYGMKIRDVNREKIILDRAGKYRKIFEEIIKLSVSIEEDT